MRHFRIFFKAGSARQGEQPTLNVPERVSGALVGTLPSHQPELFWGTNLLRSTAGTAEWPWTLKVRGINHTLASPFSEFVTLTGFFEGL